MAKKGKKQKKAKKVAAAAVPGAAAATATPAVTVRHYCQGIGDCHLLSFPKADGTVFRMLIDCGIHSSVKGGPVIIDEIVADIKAVTGGKIDVLVVTHEHWDHVSGFSTAAEIFKDFTVGEVWMAWTENPAEPLAAQLDKYKGQALAALQVRQPKARRRAQSRPASDRHSRWAAGDPRLPVRRQGRQGAGRAQRGREIGRRQGADLSRTRHRPVLHRRRAGSAHLCARPAARQEAAQSRGTSRRDVPVGRRAAAGRWNAR